MYLSQALLEVLLDEIIDRFAKGFGPVADALFHQPKSFVEFQSPLPECRLAAILYSTYFCYSYGHTILTLPFFRQCRSVPTEDQILVPETLLKKRKSQEKEREERAAETEKRKKVSRRLVFA